MFSNTPFDHGTIENYVKYFGTLFNNVNLERYHANGAVLQTISVPIAYASKEKQQLRVDNDPEINRPAAAILPRMSFEIVGMNYDAERKLNTMNRYVVVDPTSNQRMNFSYMEVPYNIEFNLYIYAKYMTDGFKIVQQILPNFTPDFTATLELVPELELRKDIPLVYRSTSLEDQNEGQLIERRILIWTIHFTMKGYLFGPVKTSKIIKLANVNFYTAPGYGDGELEEAVGNVTANERVTVRPGLTANGEPTSNISLTIPYANINVEDDWTYIVKVDNLDTEGNE